MVIYHYDHGSFPFPKIIMKTLHSSKNGKFPFLLWKLSIPQNGNLPLWNFSIFQNGKFPFPEMVICHYENSPFSKMKTFHSYYGNFSFPILGMETFHFSSARVDSGLFLGPQKSPKNHKKMDFFHSSKWKVTIGKMESFHSKNGKWPFP